MYHAEQRRGDILGLAGDDLLRLRESTRQTVVQVVRGEDHALDSLSSTLKDVEIRMSINVVPGVGGASG